MLSLALHALKRKDMCFQFFFSLAKNARSLSLHLSSSRFFHHPLLALNDNLRSRSSIPHTQLVLPFTSHSISIDTIISDICIKNEKMRKKSLRHNGPNPHKYRHRISKWRRPKKYPSTLNSSSVNNNAFRFNGIYNEIGSGQEQGTGDKPCARRLVFLEEIQFYNFIVAPAGVCVWH